jgi:predicted CoA-binding protein
MMAAEFCELPAFQTSDQEAWRLIQSYKTVATVGLSKSPEKPGHFVPKYLKERGYRIIPVNPTAIGESLLGEKVYATLREIQDPVHIVQIFRPSADVPPIVEDAIAIGAKVVWMQEGIVNNTAAQRAKEAGLAVVMDKCMLKVHRAMSS